MHARAAFSTSRWALLLPSKRSDTLGRVSFATIMWRLLRFRFPQVVVMSTRRNVSSSLCNDSIHMEKEWNLEQHPLECLVYSVAMEGMLKKIRMRPYCEKDDAEGCVQWIRDGRSNLLSEQAVLGSLFFFFLPSRAMAAHCPSFRTRNTDRLERLKSHCCDANAKEKRWRWRKRADCGGLARGVCGSLVESRSRTHRKPMAVRPTTSRGSHRRNVRAPVSAGKATSRAHPAAIERQATSSQSHTQLRYRPALILVNIGIMKSGCCTPSARKKTGYAKRINREQLLLPVNKSVPRRPQVSVCTKQDAAFRPSA